MEDHTSEIIQVLVIVGVLVLWIWRSYRKAQGISKPVTVPEDSMEKESDAAYQREKHEKISNAVFMKENLPPIPPLANKSVVVNEDERGKYNEQQQVGEEENRESILGMDLRQAIIVSEILKPKF